MSEKKPSWTRYRFKTRSVNDNRPLVFNARYPWWCSNDGYDTEGAYSTIIAYLPPGEDLLKYWDDAFDIESEKKETIEFTTRFAKSDWFVES